MLQIMLVRIATVFMLDPDITALIENLAKKAYITARSRPELEGATITFVEPPNIIAGKGAIKVYYDFGRKTLGVESPSSRETLSALNDIEECFKEIGVNIEKALIPFELTVIAKASLKPKFTNNIYNFTDLLGFNLRLVECGFTMEGGDPNSNKWLHARVVPLWSSYRTNGENLYRVTLVYRDDKSKLLRFLENLEEVLRRFLGEV